MIKKLLAIKHIQIDFGTKSIFYLSNVLTLLLFVFSLLDFSHENINGIDKQFNSIGYTLKEVKALSLVLRESIATNRDTNREEITAIDNSQKDENIYCLGVNGHRHKHVLHEGSYSHLKRILKDKEDKFFFCNTCYVNNKETIDSVIRNIAPNKLKAFESKSTRTIAP